MAVHTQEKFTKVLRLLKPEKEQLTKREQNEKGTKGNYRFQTRHNREGALHYATLIFTSRYYVQHAHTL